MTLKTQAAKKKKENKAKLDEPIKSQATEIAGAMYDHFKDYDWATDKDLFIELIGMYFKNVDKEYQAYTEDKKGNKTYLVDILNKKYKGDISKWADVIFEKSIFVDSVKMHEFLKDPSLKVLEKDPGFSMTLAMVNAIKGLYGKLDVAQGNMDKGKRLFVDGVRKMNAGKKYYPDANSTLRMTYGQVEDYIPADAVHYNYFTTLDGVMEKEDPTNKEFIVPDKLKELYKAKNYGQFSNYKRHYRRKLWKSGN